jgi:hypothetical protein
MRRLLFVLAALAGLLVVACEPNPVPADALARWEARLAQDTPSADPPPLVHELLNEAIRTGIPVVCPVLVQQADPKFQTFISGSCKAIATSDDPYTSLVTVLPALCAGDPPVGALAFPRLATAIEAGCPLLVKIAPMLNIFEGGSP